MNEKLFEDIENRRLTAMQTAIASALALHIGLLLLLPSLSNMSFSLVDSGLRLNVVLETQPDQKDDFDQSLNASSDSISTQANTGLELNVSSGGYQEDNVAESQPVEGRHNDSDKSQAIGLNSTNSETAPSVFSRSSLLKFAKQEAVRHADANPDEVKRFNRSFQSRRRLQRRKRSSYRNQYGDTYLGDGRSSGDICFVKTAEAGRGPAGTQDAPTYTVHFFRCKDNAKSQ